MTERRLGGEVKKRPKKVRVNFCSHMRISSSGSRHVWAAILILEKAKKILFKSSEIGFTGCMKYLEKVIAHLRQSFADITDKRTGRNCQYSLGDIGMSAFSVFFMQQPSFLAFQRTLHNNVGKDNTQTLFGMDKIPTDNHIRKILDDIAPNQLDENYFFLLDEIEAAGGKVGRSSLGSHTLIALDGSEYFCSKKINCLSCGQRKRSDGELEYFHAFLAATIVSPGQEHVFSLPPEFITPQDGADKQDCEWRAALRWLTRVAPHCGKYNPIYLGDDLYAKQELCSRILEMGAHFIFTCKDTSHKTLCEFRKGLEPECHREILGKGSQKREYHYSWLKSLPVREGGDALYVNWINVKISTPTGKTTYNASFITDLEPDQVNIAEMVRCARCRWKIENETFNVLKNNGYHLEHNFGHGKTNLSAVLVELNLLAFSLHAGCKVMERVWQQAREVCGSRKRMFNILWSLTAYIVFPTWDSLLVMVSTGTPPPT